MSFTEKEISEIYNTPLIELIFKAAEIHRNHHDPTRIQVSKLISIKTDGCSEDCGYCSQSARYGTDINGNSLMKLEDVVQIAKEAKYNGSSRICMGAAWRNVSDNSDFDDVLEMVQSLTNMDMEVCCTLGMLSDKQARRLADAGLYAYNHNLDSSEDYYKKIISTRSYKDRLDTIDNVRGAGMSVCSGGIIGMGETAEDRISMLHTFTQMNPHPDSVPINALVPIEGTPLEDQTPVDVWTLIRMIATTRIVMPKSDVRLSAGRNEISKEGQALCFLSGANSIFAGDKLLTAPNNNFSDDMNLFSALGLTPSEPFEKKQKPSINTRYKDKPLEKEKNKWSRPGHKIERNEKARIRKN